MWTCSSLGVCYSNKNETNLVASCYKSDIFKYSVCIWSQTEQKSVTDAPVVIHVAVLLKHIRKVIPNAYARDVY